MNSKLRNTLLWVVICTVGFTLGFLVSEINSRSEKSELVLGNFMDQLAALYFLEKGNVDGARFALRNSSEGAIISFNEFGVAKIDPYSIRGKMFMKYKILRDKYGPINYPDNGHLNAKLDEILNEYTKSK